MAEKHDLKKLEALLGAYGLKVTKVANTKLSLGKKATLALSEMIDAVRVERVKTREQVLNVPLAFAGTLRAILLSKVAEYRDAIKNGGVPSQEIVAAWHNNAAECERLAAQLPRS